MFKRPVMFDSNGDIYRYHKIISMTTEFETGRKIVEIRSAMDEAFSVTTTHWLTHYSDDQTDIIAALEEDAKEDPAFTEHEDPVSEQLTIALSILTDEQAETIINAFPEWHADISYQVGDRVRYEGVLYKVIQAHTSQEDWTPDVTPALFVRLTPEQEDDDPTTVPEWVQPSGSADAYNIGDRVIFDGQVYESVIDGNVWSPADYPAGWQLIPVESQE